MTTDEDKPVNFSQNEVQKEGTGFCMLNVVTIRYMNICGVLIKGRLVMVS